MIRKIVLAITLLAAGGTAALAQAAPDPNKEQSMLSWPIPETVSPEGRAMAALIASMPIPDPMPPVAAQRQFADAMQADFGGKLQQRTGVRVEAATIAGVAVRIVYPRGMSRIDPRGPVLLNLHGGGFSLDSGSLTETIPIAAATGIPVVAVLYRLAPEHPFPAALDDADAVYRALEKDHGAERIAVYGTSAGAGLGAQLISRLVRHGRPVPAALGFFSGSGDLSKAGDSESWMPLPNNADSLSAAMKDYIGATPLTDPDLSAQFGDLAKFPPTLAVTSTRDILLSGTSIFARKLHETGVDADLIVFDGLPHAFWAYMDIPESVEANAIMAKFLKDRLSSGNRQR